MQNEYGALGEKTVTGKNWTNQRKTQSIATLSTTNPTLTVLEVNVGLCSGKLATHC
jgi:hypothetical protein